MKSNQNINPSARRWNFRSLFTGKTEVAPPPAPTPEPDVPPGAPRILVVDDDEVIRKATAMKLKAHGYAVSTASDGPSAIHTARSEHPDLILLDLNFPPDVSLTWDGFSILSWLRRLDATKNIPVVILTGNRDGAICQRARAAGVDGFFNKPVNFEPLFGLIEARLRRAPPPPAPNAAAMAKD